MKQVTELGQIISEHTNMIAFGTSLKTEKLFWYRPQTALNCCVTVPYTCGKYRCGLSNCVSSLQKQKRLGFDYILCSICALLRECQLACLTQSLAAVSKDKGTSAYSFYVSCSHTPPRKKTPTQWGTFTFGQYTTSITPIHCLSLTVK